MPRAAHLFMRRADLDSLPEPIPPPGYTLRAYQRGDESDWLEIIRLSYGGEWGSDSFARCIRDDDAFLPERLLFVTHAKRPVGTVSAFQKLYVVI